MTFNGNSSSPAYDQRDSGRCAILHQPDLCRARSFRPAPSNRAGSHSKSIRNRSGRPVVGKHSRSPAAAGNNTAPWPTRVCQARLRQRSQRPRVFSLYASCRLIFLFRPTLSLALMAPAIRGNLRTTVRLASAPSHHSGEQRTNALTWLFQ
jgi:hypothetical protein